LKPVRIPLGPGPTVEELVRRADGWPGLLCLRGSWAGGAPIIASHPVRISWSGLVPQPPIDAPDDFLGGGWFGWFAFDGTSRLAFHDHLLRLVDGEWHFEALWSDDRATALSSRLAAWTAVLSAADARPAWTIGEFDGAPASDHLCAVERAVELIRAGELYQVNVCTRLDAAFSGRPAGLFADAAAALDPAFGAYVAGDDVTLVSLSPELFLRRRGRDVMSAPIKGTLPLDVVGNDAALRRSAKDVAENVMIVDLVRNDLGRVSETGTVRASALLDVQAHPGVWHLVSTVEGRLRPEVSDADLLRATFPPGSVTGAPKLRALSAIGDLERVPRGVYTGAIGFASPSWGAEFSVAIRTFEITGGRAGLGVGGGITADSVPMLEWRECLHKAEPLLRAAGAALAPTQGTPEVPPTAGQREGGLLETILGVDGVPVRLADHLARLDRSARELYGAGVPDVLAGQVRAAAASVPVGRAVLRVVVGSDLAVSVTVSPAGGRPVSSEAVTADRRDGLWRHKWADRSWAERAEAQLAEAELAEAADAVVPTPTPGADIVVPTPTPGADIVVPTPTPGADIVVPLFVAADGAVLETTRGNVFLVEPDGTLVTAPLRDDVLPGVTRRALLDLARDEGRPSVLRTFDVDEATTHAAFWTSSLSGAVPIHRLNGVELPRADELVAGFAHRLLCGGPVIR
jgi:para-aminobenzoate synthetase/4-amino-4-deoxychorismate lyase